MSDKELIRDMRALLLGLVKDGPARNVDDTDECHWCFQRVDYHPHTPQCPYANARNHLRAHGLIVEA